MKVTFLFLACLVTPISSGWAKEEVCHRRYELVLPGTPRVALSMPPVTVKGPRKSHKCRKRLKKFMKKGRKLYDRFLKEKPDETPTEAQLCQMTNGRFKYMGLARVDWKDKKVYWPGQGASRHVRAERIDCDPHVTWIYASGTCRGRKWSIGLNQGKVSCFKTARKGKKWNAKRLRCKGVGASPNPGATSVEKACRKRG